ncbi:MAG: PKD domain-containing protein [Bacteroidetes bacterium]|nr:PKD domain-containing protein [Bacteroidota bacterium]
MKNNIKYASLIVLFAMAVLFACNKTDYSFGNIKTPSNLSITAVLQGYDTSHLYGDGSGKVTITANASNAITYKFYFGNGDSLLSATGSVTYTYSKLDTNQYIITVNAIGTGGAISTFSKQITVYYLFPIAASIDSALTSGTSKKWSIAHDSVGHFGVGPSTSFSPDYYTAQPNEKPACAYDGVITFTHVGTNNISINVNNQGSSFLIGAATSFYGQTGGDGCYPVTTGGTQTLTFGTDLFAGSNSSNSTGVQITVPGNGLINFGTGANTYEILYVSSTVMVLRNIGIDGNAWYQIFKAN